MQKCRYITVLSVIACIMVIVLHTYTMGFQETNEWVFERLIRSVAYCAVPIFFMITGATLIDYRERYDTKTFFKKRLLKVVLPLLIWSIVYFVIHLISGRINPQDISIKFLIEYFINVRANSIFWFLVVIIGIYLAIPVISLIPKENRQKSFLYIIVVSFITFSFLPFIFRLFGMEYNNDLKFPLTSSGWIIFIFIGYYISHYDFSFKLRIILYILGILGFSLLFFGGWIWSFNVHEYVPYFDEYYNVPCMLYSSAFFLAFKNIKFETKAGNIIYKICEFVAPTTMGIYIIHMMIKDGFMQFWGLSGFGGDTLLMVVVFASSFIIVKLMKLIPHSNYVFP